MILRFLFLYLVAFLGFSPLLHSQVDGVGINTTNPRTTLEVAGDANISSDIKINTINDIESDDEVTFLIQTGTDFVRDMDANAGGKAIAYFQEYVLSNMNRDWIAKFDTNIPSADYVVTIISAYFNQELRMTDSSGFLNFSTPYTSASIDLSSGNWIINADYPSAHNATGTGVWVINTLILSKAFSKELTQQTVIMGGAKGGAASTPIID